MKRIMFFFLVLAVVFCICSCEEGLSNTVTGESNNKTGESNTGNAGNDIVKVELDSAIDCLGTVNRIYDNSSSRFITGETILNYRGSDVVFIGYLVEYNELTKSFADYVETITKKNNAMMHQNYSVIFDKDKKYVEFCAYVDKKSGEVKSYEVRVFEGDFVYRNGEWYAKACDFDNTLTRDLTNDVDVDFGFTLDVLVLDPATLPTSDYVYDCNTGIVSNSSSADDSVTAPAYNPSLADEVMTAAGRIGSIAKIFDDGKVVYKTYGGRAFYTCMVEYSSVNARFTNLFDASYNSEGFNAMYRFNHSGFGSSDQKLNSESTYIEVIGEVDSKTGEITNYDLRRVDQDAYKAVLSGGSRSWYATFINVSEI